MNTPTPPCLGEREAVARIVERNLNQTAWPFTHRVGYAADTIIAEHIEPLRTENETLRAEVARLTKLNNTYRGEGVQNDQNLSFLLAQILDAFTGAQEDVKNHLFHNSINLFDALTRARHAMTKPNHSSDTTATLTKWYADIEAMSRALDGDLPDNAELCVVGADGSQYAFGTYGELRQAASQNHGPYEARDVAELNPAIEQGRCEEHDSICHECVDNALAHPHQEGEREVAALDRTDAVARTIMGQTTALYALTNAIIAEHIEPLRIENETLRARVEEARRATDRVRQAMLAKFDTATRLADERYHQLRSAEAERDAAIARVEEAERGVENLSATIAAWEGAFGTIQSHLQDRIAMNDPARPDVYLRIVEGSVDELPRISRQIYAATQYRSQSTQAYANRVDLENSDLTAKLAQAEGEIATMRAALVAAEDALHDASGGLSFNDTEGRQNAGQALQDLSNVIARFEEPPHGD